jgi:RNA polymerase subunit RPABC4/transcription elongation factor Spt4
VSTCIDPETGEEFTMEETCWECGAIGDWDDVMCPDCRSADMDGE